MRDFRELKVWEKAHRLTLAVYVAAKALPKDEVYGLTSQIRRAASSIPANIAEGCGRMSDAELSRYCGIAFASANELEYHLLLARDLDYLTPEAYDVLNRDTLEVKKMLAAFIVALRQQQ
ncbi:MAG: four helix bundle protein [Chloroflexota bacterium]|nr:four helix bundle protein [Chloroflexota bacterium]